MKTRLLIIIGPIFISGLIYANSAHALPFISPEDSYENARHVVIGKVLSVEILSEPYVQKSDNIYSERFGFALYEIQVEDYLKNPLNNSTMKLLGQYTNQLQTRSYETYPYEINQRVLLYIQEIHNMPGYELVISAANSRVIPEEFSSGDVMSRFEYNTSPLKQIKDGIQFHNVKCNVGLELVYKNDHNTSACVILTTKIELMVRGWADDMRVISGCFGERYDMCYPSDKNEYRKALYEYYFGDDNDLPSSSTFEFTRLHSINACNEKPQICLGEFDNGTKIRVACDYRIHSCGVIPFDRNDYKTEENEN